eukprot:s4156_g4.t1
MLLGRTQRQVQDLKSANSRRSGAYAWTSPGVGIAPASDDDSELLAGPCAPTTWWDDLFRSLINFCCRVTPCRLALLCGLLFLTTMALVGRFVLNTGSDEKQGLRGALWNSSAGLPPSLGLLCVSYGKEMAFDPNDQTVVHVRFTFAVVGVWRSLLEDFLLYLMQFTRFQAIYPESIPNSCIRAIRGAPEHGTPQIREEAKPKDNRTSMHSETAEWASATPQPGAGTTVALHLPHNATNTSFQLHDEDLEEFVMLPESTAESQTDSTSSSTWKTSFHVDSRFSRTSTGSTTTSKQLASMFVSPVPVDNSSTTRTSSASSFSSTFSSTASNTMPEDARTAIATTTYTTVGSTVTRSFTTFHGTASLATTSPATTHTSSFQTTSTSETIPTTSNLRTTAASSGSTPTTSMTTIADTSTRTSLAAPATDTFTATYSTTSSATTSTIITTSSSTMTRTSRTDIGTAPAENAHSTSTTRSIHSNSMAHISVTGTSTLTYTRSTATTTSLGLSTDSTPHGTATNTSTACTSSTVTSTVASKSTSASTTALTTTFTTVTGTATATRDTAFKFQLEGPSPAVPNCYLEPLVPKSGCLRAAVLVGVQFGLNQFGQETTGKRICLNRLREAGLNTFAPVLQISHHRLVGFRGSWAVGKEVDGFCARLSAQVS